MIYAEVLVYLAYLDDSDTKTKAKKWQVMSAIIMPASAFKFAEIGMGTIPEKLMGDNFEKFVEFHACELYGGFGPFECIDQSDRFAAIEKLLTVLQVLDITVVFGAVNLSDLESDVYGSADPVDVCFRKCIAEIKSWARHSAVQKASHLEGKDITSYPMERVVEVSVPHLLGNPIIIVLDVCDGKTKSTLQKSFRSLRPSFSRQGSISETIHDDLYFGDSKYSIGIQLADLCSYFIARNLEGDTSIEHFFKMIEPRIYQKDRPWQSSLELAAKAAAVESE